MAITLDGVSLPDLIIEDEFSQSKVRSVFNETLGGRAVVWETSRSIKYLDLMGGEDFGWITRSTLSSLRAKADVPGATYTLVYESDTYTVRFRNEEGDAIEATPVVARPNQATGDYYKNVTIKLMAL